MKKNIFSMHSTIAAGANLASMVWAARAAGFDGIEPEWSMLEAYLQAGYTAEQLRELLQGLELPGVGWIADIECQGSDFDALLRSADEMFQLCQQVGIRGVQLLTGPVDVQAVKAFRAGQPFDGYTGLQHLDMAQQLELTADNLGRLADLALPYGVTLYLEPLCWTPLADIRLALQVIQTADRPNAALVIDFWQCFTAGNTPQDISNIPSKYIYGVHIGDARPFTGGIPDEQVLRNVPLGSGALPLADWVAAVKKTGFTGWWACESFDRLQNQMALGESAEKNLHDLKRLVE